MIPKITSHELNNILINANEKLDNLVLSIKDCKEDIAQKLKIMRYEAAYIEDKIKEILDIINTIYSKEDEQQYGALGIKIKLLD